MSEGLKEKPSWWFAGGEGWGICLVSEREGVSPGVPCLSHGESPVLGAKRSLALSILNWLLEFPDVEGGDVGGIKSLEGSLVQKARAVRVREELRGGAGPHSACAPSCPGRGELYDTGKGW